jgi:hypothetical protein
VCVLHDCGAVHMCACHGLEQGRLQTLRAEPRRIGVCFDAPKDLIIVPSHHVCEPADKMRKPSCPTCRTAIQQGVPLVEPPPAE